jgi:hypothetical protein
MKTKTPSRTRWLSRMVSLSFEVVAITEKNSGSVSYFETTLRNYTTSETITVRGNPWRIGSKVDFFMKP